MVLNSGWEAIARVNFLADLLAGGILLLQDTGAPPAGAGHTERVFCKCAVRTMVEEFLQSEGQKESSLLFRSLEDSTFFEALNQMDCHPKQKTPTDWYSSFVQYPPRRNNILLKLVVRTFCQMETSIN